MSKQKGSKPPPPEARLDGLTWSTPDEREASLDAIYHYVVESTESNIQWYSKSKRPNKRWARWLRSLSIILASAAAIIPLLAQVFESDFTIQPAWASIALLAAAATVALDRLYGFSAAWTRFMTSELLLQFKLNSFYTDWQRASATTETGTGYDVDNTLAMIDMARAMRADVDTVVQNETAEWVKEFQSALDSAQSAVQGKTT